MIALLTGGIALWRVLAICGPLLMTATAGAYLFGHHDGVQDERLAVAQAAAGRAVDWSKWLTSVAEGDVAFDADVRSVTVSNVLAAQKVDDASRGSGDQCFSPDFLRAIGELR